MKKNKSYLVILFICLLNGFLIHAQTKWVNYVNPFIGTDGAGHAFPGAVMPFGMVQLSPDTRIDGSWEGCAGYHYSDKLIYGFSHTHLSGTGVSDYGDVLLMPTTYYPNLKTKSYASKFDHKNEQASAGYYQVLLQDGLVNAELTTTKRVGIHRYKFPASKQHFVSLDLFHRDNTLKSFAEIQDSVTIVGYRVSDAWAKEQHVYFVIKFNKPIIKDSIFQIFESADSFSDRSTKKTHGAILQFNNKDTTTLVIKVGISQTSIAGAIKNLEAEAPHWNFNLYKKQAADAWEKELSKIEVKSNDINKLSIFYTALYHCMIHPSIASDVDGNYRGRDQKIYQANGFKPYTVFSLWDTFRGLHPLFTIIDQKRTNDFLNTFLAQHEQAGRLPMWELSANETNCMIGFHSVSVIADALSKKIGKGNALPLYKAMQQAAEYPDLGIPEFNAKNYLQIDDESESVSKTLEYAYDNWCIAQVAKQLNKPQDYDKYMNRSLAFVNLFDSKTGFMRPRKNGNWYSPFDAKEVNNHFTEANSWQYSFFVPHNIPKLIELYGGEKNLEAKLDDMFTTNSKTTGREQVDITGLIGQYAHGNEPSHHLAYLYNYVNAPIKAQEKIKYILENFYLNTPNGLIGNEDCGQMSAWYVLSAMGFYQVTPGNPEYALGYPLFDEVIIHLESGKKFIINKQETKSAEPQFAVSYQYNRLNADRPFIYHESLMNGGTLTHIMRPKQEALSIIEKRKNKKTTSKDFYLAAPIINSSEVVFDKTTTVSIENASEKSKVYYTINGTMPSKKSMLYTKPFLVDSTIIINAITFYKKEKSSATQSKLYKRPNNWSVHISSVYNKQYSAGGDRALIDGLKGTKNWRSGGWQGYQGQDFECIVDLKTPKNIKTITASFLQDTQSWIILPTQVEYYVSEDGLTYRLFKEIDNGIMPDDYSVQKRYFTGYTSGVTNARYVKVIAKNFGKLPEWHLGKGYDAFIFIDEIEVN